MPAAAGSGGALLELLLASALFLVAVLSVTPLFLRAAGDVRAGRERSEAAALAEGLIESGAETGLHFHSVAGRRWARRPPAAPDRASWTARVDLRVYPLDALDDGRIEAAEASTETDGSAEAPVRLLGREVELTRTVGGVPVVRLIRFIWGPA